jgi:adenine phosphoribosyltransferase
VSVDLRTKIREVPDFPTPGVDFKDITPLLADAEALKQTVAELADWVRERKPDIVLGAEARGFILGAAIAEEAGVGFVPARRPGKLPPETVSASYVLEYAICRLVKQLGAEVVGACFIIELGFLGGRERLSGTDLHALIKY